MSTEKSTTVTAVFCPSEEVRRQRFEQGEVLPEKVSVSIDLQSLELEDRALLLRHGLIVSGDTIAMGYHGKTSKPSISIHTTEITQYGTTVTLNHPATLDAYDLESLWHALDTYEEEYKDMEAEVDRLIVERRREIEEELRSGSAGAFGPPASARGILQEHADRFGVSEELIAAFMERCHAHAEEVAEKNAAKEAALKAEKQREHEARLAKIAAEEAWIDANGSQRLKMMLERGYEYHKTYEEERARIEFPGFAVDTGGERFDWGDRANPSEYALTEATDLQRRIGSDKPFVEIVWLKYDRDGDYATDCEALRVKPSWSRFHLIRDL